MMWNVFKILQHRLKTILNEWEIPALVLISLSLQSILIVLGYRRKFSTSEKLIFFPWITYLLASWFATVSLGIISNTIPNLDVNDKVERVKLDLAAFWAPFFLLHLAGPDTITAYSLEDNALWRKASYNASLIKIGERIWVLRSGSSENFKATTIRRGDPGPNYARYMEEYHSKKVEGFEVTTDTFEAPVVSDISFPVPANVMIPDATSLQCAYKLFKTFKQLFSDLILSIQDIKNSQSYFQKVQFEEAFKVIEIELGFMYDVFFTKAYYVYSGRGGLLRSISFSCTLIVILVFMIKVDREAYKIQDRKITYVLLSGAIILEIYSVLLLLKSDWSMLWLSNHKNVMANLLYKAISFIPLFNGNKRWSNTMGQYNLITYCLKHKAAMCGAIQRFLFHYEMLEKNRYQHLVGVSEDLKKLIFEQLLEKSKSASDLKACTELCGCRGDRVLRTAAKCPDCINKEKLAKQQHESFGAVEREFDQPVTENAKCIYEISEENRKILQESVEVEFDQSILLWHIATDLCYYSDEQNNTGTNPVDNDSNCKVSKLLSDYMLYLLVMRPIMLPNGIEQIRFQDTCAEAIEFFQERKSICEEESQACIKLLEVNTEISPSIVKGDRSKSVLFDGCRLAKSLKCLGASKEVGVVMSCMGGNTATVFVECRRRQHSSFAATKLKPTTPFTKPHFLQMMKLPSSSSVVKLIVTVILFLYTIPKTHALGSGATIVFMLASTTVCGIVASQPTQHIEFYKLGQTQTIPIDPNTNFTSIFGGQNFFSGLCSGGYSLLC
uniref:DUF4220 domain-containing protein n=1 Tax=Fagus sylvatica TaxID=28930 RepID=A0A2N9IFM8_FAGSY